MLAFGLFLSGCATATETQRENVKVNVKGNIKGNNEENELKFPILNAVPLKDFTSLGLIFTENVVENAHDNEEGTVFTYYGLLKKAKELGADSIINLVIDVIRDDVARKRTYYGSALAIKYVNGTLPATGVAMSTVSSNSGIYGQD
jgi:hypothetical protein